MKVIVCYSSPVLYQTRNLQGSEAPEDLKPRSPGQEKGRKEQRIAGPAESGVGFTEISFTASRQKRRRVKDVRKG